MVFKEPIIGRNVHGSTRQSLDWHYDGLEEVVKVLLYLTDVDERTGGCFTAFLHTKTGVPLKIRPEIQLKYLNPRNDRLPKTAGVGGGAHTAFLSPMVCNRTCGHNGDV